MDTLNKQIAVKVDAEVESLSTRALLVSVTISQWTGRKLDKRATETANNAHNARKGAGNYNKKLLPAAKELETVGTIASQARKYYYEQTLPWLADGTRIISGHNYLKFQTEFRKIQSTFESAVREFKVAYPRLQLEAQSTLGDLFSSDEYPSNIGERFGVEVNFFPMPDAKDFRVAVSDAEKRAFERKMKAIEAAAMHDACNRLFEVVKTATEKLKDPKAIFRDSLLNNIAEVAALIPALNIAQDSTLDALGVSARLLANSINADILRVDAVERDTARRALSDIEGKMSAYMGGLKS